MARLTQELNGLMNRTAERVRKKKIVGQGKDFRKKATPTAGSASNASFVNFGGGAMKAGEAKTRERYVNYARRQSAEQREIKRDPEKRAAQEQTNREALGNIANELLEAKRDKRPVNREDVFDYAQDYIPTDDSLGKAERKRLNKNKAKGFYKNRNK